MSDQAANASTARGTAGVLGQSSSVTGTGVEGVNLAGGPALQAVVSDNTVAPLKVSGVSSLVFWLLGTQASFITGGVYNVDGGMTA